MYIQTQAFTIHRDDPLHRVVRTEPEFWAAIRWLKQQPAVTVDTETSGTAWYRHARICGVAMGAWSPDGRAVQSFYFPCRHQTAEHQLHPALVAAGSREILEDSRIEKLLYNIKFDEHMFMRDGVRIYGPRRDVMIEAHLYDENEFLGLEIRAARELGDKSVIEHAQALNTELQRLAKEARVGVKEFKERTGFSRVGVMQAGVYACHDVEYTARLGRFYDGQNVRGYFGGPYSIEMDLTRVLFEMEENGLPINAPYLQWLAGVTAEAKERLRPQVYEQLGGYEFDLGSDDEVRKLLCQRLHLEDRLHKRTEKGLWSVDREVLEHFADEFPALAVLNEYRIASKINSTYTTSIIDRLGDDGLLHGDFKQVGTNTGRLSAEKPNLHNFASDSDKRAVEHSGKKLDKGGVDPWSVKRAFVNRVTAGGTEWTRLCCDYSQIELRVLAHASMDPVLVEAYLKGEDVHERTQVEVFGSKDKSFRRLAKILNFGLSYVMSFKGYARQAKVTEDEAKAAMERFFDRYAGIASFRKVFWDTCRRDGCKFQNMFGYPRRIPNLASLNSYERGRAERQAIGSLIQGTAAILMKLSMVRLWHWEQRARSGIKFATTIHDDLQIDVPKRHMREIAQVTVNVMEDFPQFRPVPILVEPEYFDTDWSEKKKLPEGTVTHGYAPSSAHS